MCFVLASLALSLSYPVQRDGCKYNLGGHIYDFTDVAANYPLITKTRGNQTYYIAFCRDLTATEIGTTLNPQGYSVARKNSVTGEVQFLVARTSFDAKPINPTNFTKGVVYYGEGEPVFDSAADLHYTFDVNFELTCDPSITTTTFALMVSFDDDQQEARIVLGGSTKYGCQTGGAVPTPTPSFAPDCKFVYRYATLPQYGLQFDLKELNDGPGGIRIPITIAGQNYVLFYQPCERIPCPINASLCSIPGYSSAWLCNTDMSECTSYGVAVDDMDVDPIGDELTDGVYIKHHAGAYSIRNEVTCDMLIPSGHFNVNPSATLSVGGIIKIQSNSSDFCIQKIVDPVIPTANCSYNVTEGGHSLKLNLSALNKDKTGWVTSVKVNGKNRTLMYNPCGPIYCPDNAVCDGDEDATLWLCTAENDYSECLGYGLFDYPLEVSMIDGHLANGIQAQYYGDDKRYATVKYLCDYNLQPGQIGLPQVVVVDGTHLSFYATARDVCLEGPSPTPIPSFYPTVPSPGPSPSLNPYPNSKFIVYNQSMYIAFDLKDVNYGPLEVDTILAYKNQTNTMHSLISPWELKGCPSGYENPYEVTGANMWACWVNQLKRKVCYSIGDKRIGVADDGIDLENGVILRYEGYNNVDAEVRIRCDDNTARNRVRLDEFYTVYHQGMQGPEFSYKLKSLLACPQAFSPATPTPPATPTSTPNPSYSPVYAVESTTSSGQVVGLDLNALDQTNKFVVMFSGSSAERTQIYFSPVKQITCPSGYFCDDDGSANVWKCYILSNGKRTCIVGGDSRYGLQLNLGDSLPSSISVVYSGGYGGMSTQFVVSCNESLADREFNIVEMTQQDNTNVNVIQAQAKEVCPHSPYTHTPTATPSGSDSRSGVTGGSVFLSIAIVGAVLYITIGVFAGFVKSGTVAAPNASFWTEFGICIKTGALFVASCGKKSTLSASYDSI